MSDLKTKIYHYLDKNGIKGNISASMSIGYNLDEQKAETNFPKTFRLSSNPFNLRDEEFENAILDYIYDTTSVRIGSLINIDKYASIAGLPFIIEIFREGDFNSIFTLAFGTINGTLILNETDKIISLGNIETINGDLKLKGSRIESLGKLKTVNGSIYIRQLDPPFTNLNSLDNLETVTGNAILKSSPLADIGKLKHVGETLNLRKTNISTLGNLEFVGGDLFLPRDKINSLDTSCVKVGGNLKYFSN